MGVMFGLITNHNKTQQHTLDGPGGRGGGAGFCLVPERRQQQQRRRHARPGGRSDPQGPSEGSDRVIRGGCWGSYAQDCRLSYRYYCTPVFRSYGLGFRVVVLP